MELLLYGAAGIGTLLLVVEMARRAWYRAQLRGDNETARQAYRQYRESADEFEKRTGDTRYHSVDTNDESRRQFLKKNSRGG